MPKPQTDPTKVLYVEGSNDLTVLVELLRRCLQITRNSPPPEIKTIENAPRVRGQYLSLKERLGQEFDSGLVRYVGLIQDADASAGSRWQQIRDTLDSLSSGFDWSNQADLSMGVHLTRSDQKNFSAWVMPDNTHPGMLENFLMACIPSSSVELLDYAEEVARAAKNRGAPFRENHFPKAHLATWFAWQDPPHLQLTNAAKMLSLEHSPEPLRRLLTWYCRAFDLPHPPSSATETQ